MAKKDVGLYFDEICKNYRELIDTLKELEEECSRGLVDPDRIENLKKIVEPAKANYERISYIMYLLNRPNRNYKAKKYDKSLVKQIQELKDKKADLNSIIKENNECIKKI